MARLPTPGGDNGNWGDILNEYLSQVHNPNGTLKDNAVTNSAIAPDAITASEIQDGTIQEAQLASSVQTKLNQSTPTWNTLSGKPAVIAAGIDAATARGAIGAVDSAAVALEVANPESAVNDAVSGVATGVLNGGAEGLIKLFDARSNLSAARPAWLGQVVWLINEGASNPTHIANGDLIWEVAIEEAGWTPSLLPNTIAWFDAQQLALSNGVAIDSWPDLSGNSNHLVQATPGARPLVDSTKINGHPAVVSDGTDDYLHVTLANDVAAPYTIYAVAGTDLADNTSGSDWLISSTKADTTGGAGVYRSTTEQYVLQRGTALGSTASAWTAGPKLLKLFVDTSAGTSYLDANRVQVVSGAGSGSMNIHTLRVFTNATMANFAPLWAGEIIVVQGAVSNEDDNLVFEYLNTRWGLGL